MANTDSIMGTMATMETSIDGIREAFRKYRQSQNKDKEVKEEEVKVVKEVVKEEESKTDIIIRSGVINRCYDHMKNKLESDRNTQDQIKAFMHRTNNDSCVDLIMIGHDYKIIGFFGFDEHTVNKSGLPVGTHEYKDVVTLFPTLGRCEMLTKGEFTGYILETVPSWKMWNKAYIRICRPYKLLNLL